MLFNSIEFLVFFVIVYTLYRVLPFRGQNLMLLVASYIFYGWWNKQFLFLILLTTSLDFCSALMIGQGRLTATQRRLPSLVLVSAAFLFITLQWEAVHFSLSPFAVGVEWSRLLPSVWTGWLVFLGAIVTVAIANFSYLKLVALPEQQRRNVCLAVSITIDLLILAFFKYFNFFIGSAASLLQSVGLGQIPGDPPSGQLSLRSMQTP